MNILFSVGGLVGNLSLEEQVIFSKQAGFDGVDYIASLSDLFSTPKKILRLTEKNRITVRAIHVPLVLVLHTPQFLFEKILKLIEYFPDCEVFNFHLSGFLNPFGHHISCLEKFKTLMRSNKIPISCESNPNEYFIFKYFPRETYDPDSFAEFCVAHNLPINLDTSHIGAWNYNVVDFFKKYHTYINLMHLSDMTFNKQHLPFGKGVLPLAALFEEIKHMGYKGVVVFEVSNFSSSTSKEQLLIELSGNIKMFKKSTR